MVSVCFIMEKKKKGANRIEDGQVFQETETESGIVWFDTWNCYGIKLHEHQFGLSQLVEEN